MDYRLDIDTIYGLSCKNLLKNYIFYYFSLMLPSFLYSNFLAFLYNRQMGKSLNFDNPKLFSEKIQWLKLYDSTSLKTELTDKLKAKDYVCKKIPELKFAKVFAIADSIKKIDFSMLPDRFVLKSNNSCQANMLVLDKNKLTNSQIYKINKFFSRKLAFNYAYCAGFELQYKDIKPFVFAEEYLQSFSSEYITEFSVFCFNGEPFIIEVIAPKHVSYPPLFKKFAYSIDWKKISNFYNENISFEDIPKPTNLANLINYSKILSEDFKFVRIDFLEVDGCLYFGEFTFTPSSGFKKLNLSPKYDEILGVVLNLKKAT